MFDFVVPGGVLTSCCVAATVVFESFYGRKSQI